MAYYVFLSHASSDRDLAVALRREVERFDVVVYMYEHDTQPGASLSEKLQTQIKAADALVVLLTQSAAASAAVQQEIGIAIGAGRFVIPILEPGVDAQRFTFLQGREYLSFDPERPDEMTRTVADYLERLRRKKVKGSLIAGAVIAGLFLIANASDSPDEDEEDVEFAEGEEFE